MKSSFLLRIFFTVWVVYLFHFDAIAAGSQRFVYLVMAMAEHHTFAVDAYAARMPNELSLHGSHSYINTNPGLSFLALPVWAVLWPACRLLPGFLIHREMIHFFIAHFAMFAFTTAACAAGTSVLLAKWVYDRTENQMRALFAAFLYAFGSIAFPVSLKLNQNGVVSFFCFLIFSLLFFRNETKNKPMLAAFIGFSMGFSLLVDYSALPFLIVMAFFSLSRFHFLKEVSWMILGAILPLWLLMAYQNHVFGNPYLPAQAYMWDVQKTDFSKSFLGFTFPSADKLADYLILPKAGIFYYVPYTILALWHLARLQKRDDILRFSERAAIAAVFLFYLVFVSMQPSPYTAFGPRYMLPVFPLICLVCGIYSRPLERPWVLLLFLGGFLAAIAGAQMGVDTSNIFKLVGAWMLRGPWLPVLTWAGTQSFDDTGLRPAGYQPYSLFLLMAVFVFLIWKMNFARKGESK